MTTDDGFKGFLADLRAGLPEFGSTPDSVIKMVWERRKEMLEQEAAETKKRRRNSESIATQLVRNIQGDLDSLLSILHDVNRPTLRTDLGLDTCEDNLRLILDRIASQDMSEYVKKTGPVTGIPEHQVVHVHTRDAIIDMVTEITHLVRARVVASPTLCIHLEGWNLGRKGKPQMMQVCFPEADKVWLICLAKLGEEAFTVKSPTSGQTLKSILESDKVRKAFWDCRGDIDALYNHFGITLDPAALVDIQLLDLAAIKECENRRRLRDLPAAVKTRLNAPYEQEKAWLKTKDAGFRFTLWGPNVSEKKAREAEWADLLGKAIWDTDANVKAAAAAKVKEAGILFEDEWRAEEAWAARPMPKIMEQYAAGDVVVLPLLYRHLAAHELLTDKRKEAVFEETKRRVMMSRAEHVEFAGFEAPEGWCIKGWCEETKARDSVVDICWIDAEGAALATSMNGKV